MVADSPQFSASKIELAELPLVATMLTIQTFAGFLLTLVTIHLIARAVEAVGWRYGFAPLAISPAIGIVAKWRLRRHPAAGKLAGGRR
ncbi:hypothetical protein [Fodinicurvata sp. EGI_FJ10296]|uniref:hypothetical protein n=1 Tax=Fodinicurvata sp. EGI_FJ10296 TaxID=3231908 RepID=UPI003455F0D5